MGISRRKFIGACAGACVLNGVQVTFGNRAYANTDGKPHYLIYVFLGGAMDGLNFLVPESGIARGNYEAARSTLQVPLAGENRVLPLTGANAQSIEDKRDGRKGGWGVSSAAEPLTKFFTATGGSDAKVAFIHSTGPISRLSTRSHFEASDFIQRGTIKDHPGVSSGWIGRYLNSIDAIDNLALPLVDVGGGNKSTLGFNKRVALPGDFNSFAYYDNRGGFTSAKEFKNRINHMLHEVYNNSNAPLDLGVNTILDVMSTLQGSGGSTGVISTPMKGKIEGFYPKEYKGGTIPTIAKNFHQAADLIVQAETKHLGIEAITINYGGWDDHEKQGRGSEKVGAFNERLAMLVGSINGFIEELNDRDRMPNGVPHYTIVLQTEFGRRLRENGNNGTDHGTGSPMVVIGDQVKSGLYGMSSTLQNTTDKNARQPDDLFAGVDVPILTDYRKVLYEILGKGFGRTTADLAEIFPNFTVAESELLGFMEGSIQQEASQPTTPTGTCEPKKGPIFSDGFE